MYFFSSKGTIIPNVINGMNLTQVMEATSAVAKLHAWSLNTSNWRKSVQGFEARAMDYSAFLVSLLHPGFKFLKEQCPDYFGDINEQKLSAYISYENMLKDFNMHRSIMPDVLVHGDYWANNILFETLPDGNVGDRLVGFVDFGQSKRSVAIFMSKKAGALQ